MKYDITFPSAEAMIFQERKSRREINRERVNPMRPIADQVTDYVDRMTFCDSHQETIDLVHAILNNRGNARHWQMSILEEAIDQIAEHQTPALIARNAGGIPSRSMLIRDLETSTYEFTPVTVR